MKDLYTAIKALAEDVSRQLGDVGQRLGALEANIKPRGEPNRHLDTNTRGAKWLELGTGGARE